MRLRDLAAVPGHGDISRLDLASAAEGVGRADGDSAALRGRPADPCLDAAPLGDQPRHLRGERGHSIALGRLAAPHLRPEDVIGLAAGPVCWTTSHPYRPPIGPAA